MAINFDQLKIINPAICYAYEPNTNPSLDIYAKQINYHQYLTGYVAQQQDMLDALIYAEQQIAHVDIKTLTTDRFISIIKNIHKLVAKSLLAFVQMKSGEYATIAVVRWDIGLGVMHKPLCSLLNDQFPDLGVKEFCHKLNTQFDINHPDLESFIYLLLKIKNNETIKPDPTNMKISNASSSKSGYTFSKLQFAYHSKLLTQKEISLIDKFFKVCILPSQVDAYMQHYAQDIILRLQTCDVNNIDNVALTMAEVFSGLANFIHPFINGNARTATVLINLLLCIMQQPSILLRYPGEVDDKINSRYYNVAGRELDKSNVKLANLIKDGINKAPYYNETAKQSTLLKDKIVTELQLIEEEFGLATAEHTFNTIYNTFIVPNGLQDKQLELAFEEYAYNALVLMQQSWLNDKKSNKIQQ